MKALRGIKVVIFLIVCALFWLITRFAPHQSPLLWLALFTCVMFILAFGKIRKNQNEVKQLSERVTKVEKAATDLTDIFSVGSGPH